MDWRRHWQEFPERFEETDFLAQVSKTVKRVPISAEQFAMIVDSVRETLALGPTDTVLDLCCGNGLITHALSAHCKAISGMDFSVRLINIAKRHHSGSNISYHFGSVLDADALQSVASVEKAYMYEALQHFKRSDLLRILSNLFSPGSGVKLLLLASVPDLDRRWSFYNTPTRKLDWLIRKIRGCEVMGTWWRRSDIVDACSQLGLSVKFMEQPQGLYTAHYRLNILIKRG